MGEKDAEALEDLFIIAEVQQHLGGGRVRTICMTSTDGLRRSACVLATRRPISVPVGRGTLGRIFNVLGSPVDGLGPVYAGSDYALEPWSETPTESTGTGSSPGITAKE